jgi:hypothetical protein
MRMGSVDQVRHVRCDRNVLLLGYTYHLRLFWPAIRLEETRTGIRATAPSPEAPLICSVSMRMKANDKCIEEVVIGVESGSSSILPQSPPPLQLYQKNAAPLQRRLSPLNIVLFRC